MHKPDFGYSIFSFIEEQIGILPDFIKIIATARTREFGRISQLPFERYSLDLSSENESNQNYRTTNDKRLCQDIENYIQYRVNMAPSITSRTRSGMMFDTSIKLKNLKFLINGKVILKYLNLQFLKTITHKPVFV